MVKRGPRLLSAMLHYIAWRELWIGVALGEGISILALLLYAYFRGG
jgi:hypothetical protein